MSLLDRLLDTEQIGERHSVMRDLLSLLNTRRSRTVPDGDDLTVLEYGFPDMADQTKEDVARLAGELTRTLKAFEPRLKFVTIRTVDLTNVSPEHSLRDQPGTVEDFSVNPFFGSGSGVDATGRDTASKKFRMGIAIEAELQGDGRREPISFALLRDREGRFHSR